MGAEDFPILRSTLYPQPLQCAPCLRTLLAREQVARPSHHSPPFRIEPDASVTPGLRSVTALSTCWTVIKPVFQDHTALSGLGSGGRSFHWYLPIAIGVMWWSGEQGRMDIHERWATACSVWLRRIIWGFVGRRRRGSDRFICAPCRADYLARVGRVGQ